VPLSLHCLSYRYPQIYHCDQKLLIDEKTVQVRTPPVTVRPSPVSLQSHCNVASGQVQRRDFDEARRKVVPSLHRSSQNYAKPLGDTLEPLLGPVASAVVRELRSGFFPFCEPVAAFRSAGDTDNSIANQLTIGDQSGAEAASSLHTRPPPSWSTVHIHGPAECGQHEVAAAVLQLLGQSGQSVPVHGLDLVSLSSTVSTRTLEEAAVGVVHQAAVVTPSILFLPHLQVIMRTGYEQLRTIIMGAIEYVSLAVWPCLVTLAYSKCACIESAAALVLWMLSFASGDFHCQYCCWSHRMCLYRSCHRVHQNFFSITALGMHCVSFFAFSTAWHLVTTEFRQSYCACWCAI
jgi:hypothetical protein